MSRYVQITVTSEGLLCCHSNDCRNCVRTTGVSQTEEDSFIRFLILEYELYIKLRHVITGIRYNNNQNCVTFLPPPLKYFKHDSRLYLLKISEYFGCDLDGAMRETRKHFSSAKRKHLEKTNRWERGGKIYLNILGSSEGILAQTQTLETG